MLCPKRLIRYPPDLFLYLEGFFYVLFSGSYLSAHTKKNLSVHSISGIGRKPVKKILIHTLGLCTPKAEVKYLHKRNRISISRKGVTAFAVFLLSFFIGIRRRAVSHVGCGSPPFQSGFLHLQKFRLEENTVKYAPRKVYIKESGGYVELTYTDFCRRRQADQSYMDKLFIPVQGCLLEVVREQYTDFYRDKERWRYLQKLDTNHKLLSLEGFTDCEGNVLDFVVDEAVDVAETVVHAVMVDRLKAALPLLSGSEQALINAIFFEGLSEREVGLRLGITQSVVNKRKAKILAKLRKIMENKI